MTFRMCLHIRGETAFAEPTDKGCKQHEYSNLPDSMFSAKLCGNCKFWDRKKKCTNAELLRIENKIIDALRLGNVGEILGFFMDLGKRQKKLIAKNSELARENEILKDQIRKHACFEQCEKRLQRI